MAIVGDKTSHKINILFCIDYLAYGGTEKQLIVLLDRLNREKFIPHLCCLRYSVIGENRKKEAHELFNKIKCNKIQLDHNSFKEIKSWFELFKLVIYIKKNNIDIIHTYFQDPTIFGLIAGKLCGIKHIITNFRDLGFWLSSNSLKRMEFVYKLCTGYVANSKSVQEKYVELFNLPRKKITVIYNGIDLDLFQPLSERKSFDYNKVNIVIVANLNREVKRVDVFLKAAAYATNYNKNLIFTVAGDGELKLELISLSKKLKISDIVIFVGRVDDIPGLLSKTDIGIISSDSEGFSNSILEYMAAGIPVICTDVGGNSEIVQHGVNGFLVNPGDYNSMGDAIIQLTTKNELYIDMQQNAYKTVNSGYSLKNLIKSFEQYYENLIINGADYAEKSLF